MTQSYFDDLLTRIKTGKWTFAFIFGMGTLSFMIPSFVFAGTFLSPFVKHLCSVGQETANVSEIVELGECSYTIVEKDFNETGLTKTQKCSEWDYEHDVFKTSITEDFELVCDHSYLRPTYQTMYMIGMFIGAPLNGFFADKFGRKTIMTIGAILGVTCTLLSSFVSQFSILLTLRFFTGLSHPSIIQTGYILCMEVCEPKYRSIVGILISLPWAIGTMWWGVLGYLVDDWRWLTRISVIPGILFFVIFFWIIDESPRWLIVQGHHDKAIKILTKAAAWNHSTLPPEEELRMKMMEIQKSSLTEEGKEPKSEKKKNGCCYSARKVKQFLNRIIVVYKTPEIRRRTLITYVLFFVGSTVYYGLSMNAVNFHLDPYMYMVINGVMEVPAYTVTAPIIAKYGRIIPTSTSYFVCGVTIMILTFVPESSKWLIITLAMIGKLCISSCYQIIYLISSELFPTEVRLQSLGTSNLVSRIGSISAPYVTDSLGPLYPWVPSVVFGGLSLAAGVATIFLPETLNEPLPETILQLEEETKHLRDRRTNMEEEGYEIEDEEATEFIALEKQFFKEINATSERKC